MIINSLYKDFNKVSFLQGLQHGLNNNAKFDEFSDEFKTTLNYPASIKQSMLWGNTKPHINKTLRKEIIKRSRLKNKANNSDEDKRLYNIQQNNVSKLNNKLKKI